MHLLEMLCKSKVRLLIDSYSNPNFLELKTTVIIIYILHNLTYINLLLKCLVRVQFCAFCKIPFYIYIVFSLCYLFHTNVSTPRYICFSEQLNANEYILVDHNISRKFHDYSPNYHHIISNGSGQGGYVIFSLYTNCRPMHCYVGIITFYFQSTQAQNALYSETK